MLNLLFFICAAIGVWYLIGYLLATFLMLLTEPRRNWPETLVVNFLMAPAGLLLLWWIVPELADKFKRR